MAVETDFQQLRSDLNVSSHLSGDASSATDIEWVDMRDYDAILITATAADLTGDGVTAFKIIANAESDGGGTDVEVKAHAVGSAPDAAGDTLVLEATSEEIRQAGVDDDEDVRYVSANITAANSADNIVVTYIRRAMHAELNKTSDSVA